MADTPLATKAKDAVVGTVEGADDVLTALRTTVKNQVVGTLKDVDDISVVGLNAVSLWQPVSLRVLAILGFQPPRLLRVS